MPSEETNGWAQYSKLVMLKLDEHQKLLETMNIELTKIHVEIAMLKVKSGIWGFAAGAIPALFIILNQWAKTPIAP